MIDPNIKHIYNIILSIFLGIVMAITFDNFFEKPRIINIYKNRNYTLQQNKTHCFSDKCTNKSS